MAEVVPAARQCRACGEVKNFSEFYRYKNGKPVAVCKPCSLARQAAYRQKRIDRIGIDAERERQREIVRRVRSTDQGRESGRRYGRAQRRAIRALIDLHRDEYEHLLLLARRGELTRANAENRGPSHA